MCVDTGHNTSVVHQFCRAQGSRVIGIRGYEKQEVPISRPHPVKSETGRVITYRYDIKVSHYKSELYAWLEQKRPEPGESEAEGFCHFPDGYDYEFYQQLTAEEKVKHAKRDNPYVHTWSWEKIRERNEASDCRVYGRAAEYVNIVEACSLK